MSYEGRKEESKEQRKKERKKLQLERLKLADVKSTYAHMTTKKIKPTEICEYGILFIDSQ